LVPASSASAPNQQERTILLNGFFEPGQWHVGDCWLLSGTYLERAGAQVHLHGENRTDHTNHADVWHSTFSVATSAMDSPGTVLMNGSSGPSSTYSWDRNVNLTPAQQQQWFTVAQVVWSSSC
jgi:hypothetical protein